MSATVARNWALRLSILLAFLFIVFTVNSQSDLQVGYATLSTEGEADLPVASALFSFRNAQGVLVAEAGVEAVSPIRRGRLLVDGSIPTGLALANPSGDSVTAALTLRDASGNIVDESELTLPAFQHTARFVTEPELFGPLPVDFVGSMTFDTGQSEGLAPLTIRQGTNRFGEALFATLPVAELDSQVAEAGTPQGAGSSIIFPHLGAGLGLTTQILLINRSSQTIRGTIQLTTSDGSPLELDLDGESGSSFDYELAPNGVFRGTLTAASGVQSGYAQVTSDGVAPSGTAVFQFRSADGSLISEAGVGVAASTSRARIFVDTFQTRTGVAVAIPGGRSGMMTFSLSDLTGSPVGEVGRNLPVDGHLAVFVDELFEDLPTSFKGILEITGRTREAIPRSIDLSAVTLKLTINVRGDPILTTLPVATDTPAGQRLIFPQVGFGSGFATSLVLINVEGGSDLGGNLSFTQSDGSELVPKQAYQLPDGRIRSFSGSFRAHQPVVEPRWVKSFAG